MTERTFIDDVGEDSAVPERKKSLQDIISAVSEKDDVISAFKAPKKRPKPELTRIDGSGWQYLGLKFLGGMIFGVGFLIVLGIALVLAWFFLVKDIHTTTKMFGKFVFLMKSLGHR